MVRAAKSRAKSRKKVKPAELPKRKKPVPALALSVDQFCASYSLGRDAFYKLLRQRRAPECIRVGRRRIITIEAAQRWAEREAEAAAT